MRKQCRRRRRVPDRRQIELERQVAFYRCGRPAVLVGDGNRRVRQRQNRQKDTDRKADRDLGKELGADDSSPEHHDERERHSGSPVQDRVPVEQLWNGIPRQVDPGEGTEALNDDQQSYSRHEARDDGKRNEARQVAELEVPHQEEHQSGGNGTRDDEQDEGGNELRGGQLGDQRCGHDAEKENRAVFRGVGDVRDTVSDATDYVGGNDRDNPDRDANQEEPGKFSREQQGRDGDCAQHAHHAREQADTRIEQQLFGDGRNPMLHGFMRSVTGSLSRLAMQHARRELHVFSSTTTEVLISESRSSGC